MTFDSIGTMYVWERGGKVWIVENDVKRPTPLIDVSGEVGAFDDHGLLGFALHPNFRQNGFIYLFYVVDHHHLAYYGTPSYNPNANEYNRATIGRITRYTAKASDNFRSVDPASRLVLLGETASTGCPILSITHGVGSLVFGTDGTLLASCGDGAMTSDAGSDPTSYYVNALNEGIISPKENIGAFRSQLVDSMNGKILRLDPATGNGVPSNPYYDSTSPRAVRSRVWNLGLRNPFRMTLKPGTGSHEPAAADPGVLHIGNVGYSTWEELEVSTGPSLNFGWPIYEGLDQFASEFLDSNPENQDAPNPLYGINGCTQRYFRVRDLLVQATLATPSWPNPCNVSQQVPATIPHFVHTRALIDWHHGSGPSRTGTFVGTTAAVVNIGAPGSPISGPQFGGNCSTGGSFYQGANFPATYQNSYFFADLGNGWIKNITFDANGNAVSVRNFIDNAGGVTSIAIHPITGVMYYSRFWDGYHKVTYVGSGNQPPTAVASSNVSYGPSPLTVQFTGSTSTDPEGQPLTYLWDFGDGSPSSTAANPSHTYNVPSGVPTRFDARLTVTDNAMATSSATVVISVNNTPPSVTISTPPDGTLYPLGTPTTYDLTAAVTDSEHADGQLLYQWQKALYHNNHNHPDAIDTNHVTSTVVTPIGCDGNLYFYRISLTVTDPAGLSGQDHVDLYPDCANTPPTISAIANVAVAQNASTGPIAFTVGDAEIPAAYVTVTGSSSNTTLVPVANIVFGGSEGNRTVTVTPAANQSGTATITVTASDGQLSSNSAFVLTVNGTTNTAPTISNILDRVVDVNTSTGPIGFTIGDAETAPGSLTLIGTSNNPTVVPNGNIVFGGSGANRTVTVTPAANQSGNATITITVSDGVLSATDTFVLVVVSAPADFSLAGSPASQTIAPGGSANYGITITPTGGFAGSVTLSVSGLPAGATGSFSVSPATTSSTLTVATTAAASTGTFTLTVTGNSGSLTHTTTVNITITSTGLITIGETNTSPIEDGSNGDLLIAQQATLTQAATLQSLSFYVMAAAGNLRLGVYDATGPGGGPGSKVAETNSFVPVLGWNTADVIPHAVLPPGSYWLAYLASSSNLNFTRVDSGASRYYSFPFGVMPATYSTSPSVCECHWSLYATLTTAPPDTDPPSTPAGLSATAVSSSQIDLAWTASTDNVAVTGYKVFRNGSQVGTSSTASFSDTGLAASTTYTYAVSAYDAAGNDSPTSATAAATTSPPPFDFALANGGATSVQQGSSVNNSITATLVSGATQNVVFSTSGLPAGATASYAPSSCSPGCGTTITITTSASTPPATSTITVTGTAGSLIRTTTFNLTVTAPPFDFALASGGATSVQQGASVTNSITATLVSGATQNVVFSASGLPAGATASYAPSSCSPGCGTTITITTSASTPLATSTITVTGTAGSLIRTTTFNLTVTATADTTAPTVALGATPVNGSTILGTVTLTATASDNVGVVGVQFLLDGNPLGAEDTTSPYSLSWNTTSATNGAHVLSARARDAASNTGLATVVNVTVDNQAPTGTVVINGGAAATNSRNSTLTLAATDNVGAVSQMRFSNTGTSFSAAEAYATTKAWQLSTGAGTKTVYVQFRDAVGNWSTAAITDTIVYDTTAPTISAVSASGVTNGSATINWTTSEPATSQVEYGPTTSYGTLTPVDNTLVTVHAITLSGLNPQTLYNYRVRSLDIANNQRIGSNATFTTLAGPPDTQPPTIPGNLTATAVSASQINLTWSASTDNVAVTGYRVFRNGTQIATVSVLSYSSTGLTPNTAYTYTVAAQDAQNNVSAQSAPANATTQPDTTAPTVSITSPSGGATVFATITITATASDNVAVAGVTFRVDGSNIGSEDTSSPYSVNLNTATLSDGVHTLTAVARDTSSLTTTSAPVSITVNNTAPPMMVRYVNTASTIGGDGTTNNTTGATRAFRSLLDAVNSLPDVLTMPTVIYLDGAGGPDTTPVNQTPFDMVTSASNYLLITTNAANRAKVPHDPARYTLMAANSNALYNNIPSHIRFDGVQVQLTVSNGSSYVAIKTSNANQTSTNIDSRISNSVIKCVVTNGQAIGFNTRFPASGAGGNSYVWNSVAYGCTTGFNNDFPNAQYANNTAFNSDFGYVDDGGDSMKVINCLAAKGSKANSIGFVGAFAAGSDYNAEDDGNGAPGAHSRSGQTFTFVNAAISDVHLAPTDTGARDFGTGNPLLGKFTDDIDGILRSGAWDIGADEVGGS